MQKTGKKRDCEVKIMFLAFFHVVAIITNLSTLRVQRYKK